MLVLPIRTRIFQEGENLLDFVVANIKKLKEGSVVVVTSKIVALSEGRTAIVKNEKEKAKIIRAESDFAVKTKHVWLTIKDGMVMANAGIDESNADGKIILLPKDSFQSADALRKSLMKKYAVSRLGVLITDSRIIPLRAGVAGVALGYAGFSGIKDYRGMPDIFGKKFVFSRTDIADSLATAAVLTMGEGREQQPLAIIESAPVEFCSKIDRSELEIDINEDLYRPIFSNLKIRKKK